MHPLLVRSAAELTVREQIDALEQAARESIATGELVQTHHDGTTDEGNKEADHFFAKDVYCRGLWIPAGCLVVGRLHIQSRVCIVAAGRCRWVDEFHQEPVEVSAPWVGEFKAGSKTAVYAYEDTYWVAVTGTSMTDPQEILHTLSVSNHEQYKNLIEQKEVLP